MKCQTAVKNVPFNVYSDKPRVYFFQNPKCIFHIHKKQITEFRNVKIGEKTGVDTILIELCEWELNAV